MHDYGNRRQVFNGMVSPARSFRGIPFRGPRLIRPHFGQIGFGTEIEFLTRPEVSTQDLVVITFGEGP
jgi:hypothetical protein